ncbi:ATP-binding protein [Paraburkholderia phosphatilytica]|uniref:ATP-binding protein n=1 Tax=Paraburkholderia phosphatilytica TaxID=2282883 RepID=UPI000E5271FB|nr:AAA family ATPase [Paraburkholderia phosphatilytica]
MTTSMTTPVALPFPFTALVGQAALQQALLLAAIDLALGGVLVSGPRGTAKSTAARALAELLPEGRFVTLPLGASEERLTGTLDIESALRDASVRFSPGLLAQAHGGVLYVDEVNLLPDALVDLLLDAAASGVNSVERDGISHSHDARFVLIGTMNPEEGELRPQLIDRFGLMVALDSGFDVALRQRIVRTRLAFDADPHAFRAQCDGEQRTLRERVQCARDAIATLAWSDEVHERVSALCVAAQVDGVRADLTMLRAARALAAFEAADAVTVAHVDRVAESVLCHRRRDGGVSVEARASNERLDAADAKPQGERADRGHAAQLSDPSTPDDADPGHTNHASHAQSDWGYLPPEPVGTTQVKGVIPLHPKKR